MADIYVPPSRGYKKVEIELLWGESCTPDPLCLRFTGVHLGDKMQAQQDRNVAAVKGRDAVTVRAGSAMSAQVQQSSTLSRGTSGVIVIVPCRVHRSECSDRWP